MIKAVAARTLFVLAALFVAAATLPIQFQAVCLPVVGVVAGFVATYFSFEPIDAPRGLTNVDSNCAFCSLIHFLRSDPKLLEWLLNPEGEHAEQIRRSLTSTDVQDFRNLIHTLSPHISENPSTQEDATEILLALLKVVPDAHKMSMTSQRHYPRRSSNPQSNVEDLIPVLIAEGGLSKMLGNYLEEKETINGVESTIRRTFSEPPSALRIQVCRFVNQGEETVKRNDPIDCPETMEVAGRTYRLSSFVSHVVLKSGIEHYIAGQIINGKKYIIDDDNVTLVNQATWEEHLRQAYLLCYPVDECSAKRPV